MTKGFHKANRSYQRFLVEEQHSSIIERCTEKLPSGMSIKDKVIFAAMVSAILNIPTERMYLYGS